MHTVIRGKPEISDLGDIELEAVVELGRVVMPLRNVRTLSVGDTITLPQLAGENMQLRLNGHAFAEGETVCATNLLCVRLTHLIPSPEDQLSSGRNAS